MFNIQSCTQDKLKQGVWKDFAGGKFLIASTQSFAFTNYFSELKRPFKRKFENDTITAEQSQELICRAAAKYILLDWKDVGEAGKEVPYSVETAYNAFYNNAELRAFVFEVAGEIASFSSAEEEADLKS